MFERIPFTRTQADTPLTSRHLSREAVEKGGYDPDNIMNAEFWIMGSTESFLRPPITDFARDNLFHMQTFDLFHYKKGSFTRRKDYRSYLLIYTYSGTAQLEYSGRKYTLNAFDGAFIDCRRPHYYAALTDWDVAVLHFDGPLAGYMHDEMKKMSVTFHEPTTGHFQQMLEELLTIYNSPSLQRDLRAAHRIEGMLLHLLVSGANIALAKREVPMSVQEAMKHMEDNYAQDISLDDLARVTNTNKYHLAKEFKKYTSFSPHDYLIRLRVNQARILLKSTTLPVVKIAHSVGVRDINNFNYLFKTRVGQTPMEYRNSPDFIP